MIRPRLGRRSFAVAFAIAFAITVFAGQAAAQEQAAIDKLVQMNKKALDDYDTLEWDSAKKTLLDALVAGKKAGLENHPVMARTYVHLGAVYITGFKNRDKAIQSFIRALEIDPGIQLSKGIATSEVNDAFAEAKRARGGAGAKRRRAGEEDAQGPGDGAAVTSGEPAPRKKAPPKSSTSDDDSEEKDLPVKIQALDCPNEDEAILDKAGDASLRGGAEPARGEGVPDVQGAGQGGVHRAADDQVAQGLVRGQDPEEGGHGQVGAVLLRGPQRRRQGGGRQRREGEPELPPADGGGAVQGDEGEEGRRPLGTGEDTENPLEEEEGPKKQGVARSAGQGRSKASTSASESANGGSVSARAAASASPRATGWRR